MISLVISPIQKLKLLHDGVYVVYNIFRDLFPAHNYKNNKLFNLHIVKISQTVFRKRNNSLFTNHVPTQLGCKV